MLVWATFEHTTVEGYALNPGEEIRGGEAPCLLLLVLAGLLPRFGWAVFKVRFLCGDTAAPCSFYPVTAIRTYEHASALRTATAYDKAFASRAKLVVDVGMGYF